MGKGIARATLKHIAHDSFLAMFSERLQKILLDKRIGCKLHTIYTIYVQTRGLVSYYFKRIFPADLPDCQLNLITHAFVHYSLKLVQMPESRQMPAGEKLVVVI